MDEGMSQVVEHLPSMHEALVLVPSTVKKVILREVECRMVVTRVWESSREGGKGEADHRT
jgi:hypothetical protein